MQPVYYIIYQQLIDNITFKTINYDALRRKLNFEK